MKKLLLLPLLISVIKLSASEQDITIDFAAEMLKEDITFHKKTVRPRSIAAACLSTVFVFANPEPISKISCCVACATLMCTECQNYFLKQELKEKISAQTIITHQPNLN